MASSAEGMVRTVGTFARKTIRKQHYDDIVLETKLKRCARLFEMSFFGIGNMLGAGIFVLSGTMLQTAGPAGVLGYAIGAISGFLTSMCYAEMSTVLPKAGSCYTYTYYTIAEIYAFMVGWTMVSNCMIGYAANSKGLSAAINALAGGVISNGTIAAFPGWPGLQPLSQQLDFVAFGWIWVGICVVGSGAKDSLIVNVTTNALGLALLSTVIIATFVFGSHAEYWAADGPNGGFAPQGVNGVLKCASIAVFAYFGFDTIANTSEEARNPKFSIPRAMVIALAVVTFIYCTSCIGLSLLVPIADINPSSPFAYAFLSVNQTWAYYTGAVAALVATCDMSYLYVLPRLLYAMASDGLLFPIFCYIWPRTQVPIWSLVVGGGLTSLLALFFDLSSLVNMNSIGVLLSYSTIGVTMLLMRYNGMGGEIVVIINVNRSKKSKRRSKKLRGDLQGVANPSLQLDDGSAMPHSISVNQIATKNGVYTTRSSGNMLVRDVTDVTLASAITSEVQYPCLRKRFHWMSEVSKRLDLNHKQICNIAIVTFVIGSIILDLLIVFGLATAIPSLWMFVAAFAIPLVLLIEALAFLVLCMYRTLQKKGAFYLPAMPLVPCLSILINTFLIINISSDTWMRFIVWNCVGLIVYFGYGISHSTAGRRTPQCVDEQDDNGVEIAMDAENSSDSDNEQDRDRHELTATNMATLMVHDQPKRKRSISTSGPTMLTPQLMADDDEHSSHSSWTRRSESRHTRSGPNVSAVISPQRPEDSDLKHQKTSLVTPSITVTVDDNTNNNIVRSSSSFSCSMLSPSSPTFYRKHSTVSGVHILTLEVTSPIRKRSFNGSALTVPDVTFGFPCGGKLSSSSSPDQKSELDVDGFRRPRSQSIDCSSRLLQQLQKVVQVTTGIKRKKSSANITHVMSNEPAPISSWETMDKKRVISSVPIIPQITVDASFT